jgi:hypothetical protein
MLDSTDQDQITCKSETIDFVNSHEADCYFAALLETGDSRLPHRLYEAIAAIEQRLFKSGRAGKRGGSGHKAGSQGDAVMRTERSNLDQSSGPI